MKKITCFFSVIVFFVTCNIVHAQTLTAQERASLVKEGWKAEANGKMKPPASFNLNQTSSAVHRKALGWKFAPNKKNGPLIPPPLPGVQKELAAAQGNNGVTQKKGLQYTQLPPENKLPQKKSLQYAQLPPENKLAQKKPVTYEKLPADKQKAVNYGKLPQTSKPINPPTQYPKGITGQEKARKIAKVSAGHKAKLGEIVKDVPQQNQQQIRGYQAQRGVPNVNRANAQNGNVLAGSKAQNQNRRQLAPAQNRNGQVRAANVQSQNRAKVVQSQNRNAQFRTPAQNRDQAPRYAPISAPPQNPNGTNKSNVRVQNRQVRKDANALSPSQRALQNRGQGINRQKMSGSNHQKIPAPPKPNKATKTNQNKTKKKGKISRAKSKVKKVFSRKKKN